MSTFRNFVKHFASNNSALSNKTKQRRQRSRTCRIEELEGREMLSVTPWALADDVGNSLQEPQVERHSAELAGNPEVSLRYTSGSFAASAPLAAAPEINQLPPTPLQGTVEFTALTKVNAAVSANPGKYAALKPKPDTKGKIVTGGEAQGNTGTTVDSVTLTWVASTRPVGESIAVTVKDAKGVATLKSYTAAEIENMIGGWHR